MWVTVWRHGEAEPGRIDEQRALTSLGRRSVQAVTTKFRAQCAEHDVAVVDRVGFSPLVRTTQTAEIIGLSVGIDPETCAVLAPGTQPEDHPAFLAPESNHQVLVSHQPFVSQLINYWLDDVRQPPLMPGGYACLQLLAPTRGGGQLVFIEPEVY